MKYMFLATDDNKMQLMHILLNANNFNDNGHEVAVVLECAAPKLLIGIADGSIKLPPFDEAMEKGIIDHACKACTANFSAAEAAEKRRVKHESICKRKRTPGKIRRNKFRYWI